jgi:type I restriction enzyme R subunit
MPVATYREKVEAAIRALRAENPILQRIQSGETVSEADLRELADLLRKQDPEIDETRLRLVYDVRTAGFLQLMRHLLGVERLERWPTLVAREFDSFIASHTTYTAIQIRFLQTLRTFVLQRRSLETANLLQAPFTQIHPNGVRGVFKPREAEEVVTFARGLVA